MIYSYHTKRLNYKGLTNGKRFFVYSKLYNDDEVPHLFEILQKNNPDTGTGFYVEESEALSILSKGSKC